MPTYDFQCKDCDSSFTLEMKIVDHDRKKNKHKCPSCKSKNVKQKISMFEAKTSRKS